MTGKVLQMAIVNGPNLNWVGRREPEVYGSKSLQAYLEQLVQAQGSSHRVTLFQSHHAGRLIDFLQQQADEGLSGALINPGAYAHTSLALGDCVASLPYPVIEIHLSNIYRREKVRHHSFIAPHCLGVISGLGLHSYQLGLEALIHHLSEPR